MYGTFEFKHLCACISNLFFLLSLYSQAMLCYWCTSNMFSLLQVLFLRIPAIREYFQIAARVKHKKTDADQPKQGFVEGVRESEFRKCEPFLKSTIWESRNPATGMAKKYNRKWVFHNYLNNDLFYVMLYPYIRGNLSLPTSPLAMAINIHRFLINSVFLFFQTGAILKWRPVWRRDNAKTRFDSENPEWLRYQRPTLTTLKRSKQAPLSNSKPSRKADEGRL